MLNVRTLKIRLVMCVYIDSDKVQMLFINNELRHTKYVLTLVPNLYPNYQPRAESTFSLYYKIHASSTHNAFNCGKL